MKIYGYSFNDKEYNLATMFKETIIKAFEIHKNENQETIASILGISDRTLSRLIKDFNINSPYKQRKQTQNN